MQSGELYGWRRRDEEALEEYERARELFAEVGAATHLAKAMLRIASTVRRAGDLEEAEKLAREGIRILKPLEDRGTLCEVQRFLAEVLLDQGKLDEAELYALKAVETVGPRTSAHRRRRRRRSRSSAPPRAGTRRPKRSCVSRSRSSSEASTAASSRIRSRR